jgi:hypothetical protein
MKIKIKWLAEVDKPQFNKFTYTQDMVSNLITNTKKLLPMKLFDFREYVDPTYLHETIERQLMLENEPKTNIGLVKDIIQEGTDLFIIVEAEEDSWYNSKVTFSIAIGFDDEIEGFGSHYIKRFYVSDELIRGKLVSDLIKEQIKNLPQAEKDAIKLSEDKRKKLGKRQRRLQTKQAKKDLKKL